MYVIISIRNTHSLLQKAANEVWNLKKKVYLRPLVNHKYVSIVGIRNIVGFMDALSIILVTNQSEFIIRTNRGLKTSSSRAIEIIMIFASHRS